MPFFLHSMTADGWANVWQTSWIVWLVSTWRNSSVSWLTISGGTRVEMEISVEQYASQPLHSSLPSTSRWKSNESKPYSFATIHRHVWASSICTLGMINWFSSSFNGWRFCWRVLMNEGGIHVVLIFAISDACSVAKGHARVIVDPRTTLGCVLMWLRNISGGSWKNFL